MLARLNGGKGAEFLALSIDSDWRRMLVNESM